MASKWQNVSANCRAHALNSYVALKKVRAQRSITNVKTRGCGLWPGVTQGTGRPARSAGSSRLRVRHPPQAQLCPHGGLHRPGQQHWHSRALASAQGGAWASRSCAHGAASHLGEGGRLHRDHAPRPRKRLRANPTCPASSVERQQVTARRERRPMGSGSPWIGQTLAPPGGSEGIHWELSKESLRKVNPHLLSAVCNGWKGWSI